MFAVVKSSRSTLRTAIRRGVQVARVKLESTRLYSSTMHDNDPVVLEREKLRNLSKSQGKYSPHEYAPGWNETLASASEAAVKADKSSGSKEDLVSNTVRFMRVRDQLDSNNENAEATTASYFRDEVSGPLKGVGKEEVTIEQDTVVKKKKVKKTTASD